MQQPTKLSSLPEHKIMVKYKVVKKKVERLEMEGTSTCPECGSILKKWFGVNYEEYECVGCGNTTTIRETPDLRL